MNAISNVILINLFLIKILTNLFLFYFNKIIFICYFNVILKFSRIRVFDQGTVSSAWTAVWGGAWLLSAATPSPTAPDLNSPAYKSYAALMQPDSPSPPVYCFNMTPSNGDIRISSLHSILSFAATEVCPQTIPGILWVLARWVNCWIRLQNPPYPICILANLLVSALHLGIRDSKAKPMLNHSCLRSLSSCPEQPGLLDMPKLRQRMSSRRGSSRGRSGRQVSSSTMDSSTFCSDLSMDFYPATRSGRGRGRGLHNVAANSLNSNSAQFQFPCSHGNLSFMASVTIELKEINAGQAVGSLGATTEKTVDDRLGTVQMNYEPSKASGSGKIVASQIPKDQAGPSVSTCKEGYPSEDEEDYQFGCRIVEEQPAPSHGD